MLDRLSTLRLRQILTVMGLASLLALGACGGGSGAPNNPYDPVPTTPPLIVLPASTVAYSGIPVSLTVTSGVAPFYAFSQDVAVLPTPQNVPGNTIVLLPNKVTEETLVILYIEDAIHQRSQNSVIVRFSPIFNAATFAPSGGDCGTNLCSGQNGTVTVIATGPTGVPLPSRQIRFDIVNGPIGLVTTNPSTPLVQTITITTDSTGKAVASVQAQVNATTQPAQIRATEVTSGQSQNVNFTVVNNTNPTGSPITVIPATATITGALTTACSTGFRVAYYIFGGNPPYTVSSSFPSSVVLVNTTVPASGGYFEAITNGACVNPLVFTVVDSAGKVATPSPTLVNQPGTTAPPAPTALVVTPPTVTDNCIAATGGKTYTFLLNGGTQPYNVSTAVANPALPVGDSVVTSPSVVPAAGGAFTVTFAGTVPIPGTVVNVLIGDAGTPQLTASAKITCN